MSDDNSAREGGKGKAPGRLLFLGNVRIGIPKSKHYLCFQRFHLFGLIVFDVVVAKQMQATVYNHMCPVGVQRLLLFFGFLFNHLTADDQVTQQRELNSRRGFKGKREHIGGFELAAERKREALALQASAQESK